ncbi:carboxypeptidase-like regulatory domain-containing protein [Psychroserpens damuponensis]|uniref:carboxypeptidase-like regulatory domain-containing protein n=1 Tax=Psychroserpens damuponensis TaxID=943936 RepID=UPI00058C0F9E|nr:carboxypeptidase-like regulatory domain-containing protein [Psychroserpens damuponensis]
MKTKLLSVFLILYISISHSQIFSGTVLDTATNKPLESVSVYFDNTTIGTSTDDKGYFSIEYTDAVQSTLVISFLGYEKIFIADYRSKDDIKILLKESANELDIVVIDADDGMSRELKLKKFKREFLGKSENGKSCKILNEDDIKLRYNKRDKTITAWSNTPIIVKNKNLKYEVSFEIIDFEMTLGIWGASSVVYTGTSFFKDLDPKKKKRTSKNRQSAYDGSVQHFIRALYNKQLEDKGYIFGVEGFVVNPYDYFIMSKANSNGIKTVALKEKLDIFYKGTIESIIQTEVQYFKIDKFGNYSPIQDVLFGGNMGSQRVGDSLPLNYGLDTIE